MAFPTTHWSLVDLAKQSEPRVKRLAWESLYLKYYPALRARLVRQGLSAEQAEDILQDFVVRKVIEKDLLARADKRMGKFRTFLATALDRFLTDRLRSEEAAKRSPRDAVILRLDECPEEEGSLLSPSDAYELAWARQVVAEALEETRLACDRAGRKDLWELFELRVVLPTMEGAAVPSYETLVERFKVESALQLSNLLVSAKRVYARVLRAVVGQYCADEQEVESEIRELRASLGQISARSGGGSRIEL